MPATQQVTFTSPGFDYGADIAKIERKRKLAEALQAQALEPIKTETAGGWVVPTSPFQGAAKLAQAWVAGKQQSKSDEEQRALATKAQKDLSDVLAQASQAYSGRAAISEGPADQGGGPGAPAEAPDAMKAANVYMTHPMTAPLGTSLMGQELSRQRLTQVLRTQPAAPQGNPMVPGPGASVMAGSGSVTPQGQPQAPQQAGMGGPAGGVPMEAWLAADPTGAKYMEQLAKDYAEGQKPVINRGFGLGRMVGGQYVPDQASLDQALAMVRGKQGIEAPMEPPVTLKLSGGQEVQLSRPEYAEFQRTGQLPTRYGQAAPSAPAASSPAPVAAPAAAPSAARPGVSPKPGLGTPGLTQSQEDSIRQQGQLAANTEAGREFISEMRKNYGLLRDVPAALANMDRARVLASSDAAKFMGPLGESKLQIQKFFRANVPGMKDLNTEGVTKVEELRSTLFNQVMDNLKKMDASPSQYQQQVMQEAFGTLGTDPAAVANIVGVFGDILRNRVDIHNETVGSAEKRGTTFPYDVKIKLPAKAGAGLQLNPATVDFMKKNGIQVPQ